MPGEHEADADSTPRRVLIVRNPVAGRGGRGYFGGVVRALERAGCPVTVRETGAPGDARTIAAAASRAAFEVLAVAGGDGTINEAINGLGREAPALAVIPMGTANVLAREIGLDAAPEAVAATIARGPVRHVHAAALDGRRFIMMAGAGFDAHVVQAVSPALKKRLGKGAYVVQTVNQFFRYRFAPLEATVDGRRYQAFSVIVANGRHYGGPYVAAPEAGLDRDRLDVVLFSRPGGWNALRYAAALVTGRLDRLADVKIVDGREVRLDGPPGDSVQADGDLLARLPVTARLAADTIALVYPEAAPPKDR